MTVLCLEIRSWIGCWGGDTLSWVCGKTTIHLESMCRLQSVMWIMCCLARQEMSANNMQFLWLTLSGNIWPETKCLHLNMLFKTSYLKTQNSHLQHQQNILQENILGWSRIVKWVLIVAGGMNVRLMRWSRMNVLLDPASHHLTALKHLTFLPGYLKALCPQ